MAKLFRLDSRKSRTVAIEVGMQNSGMAASLAVLYFNPAAAIPGAIFSVWHNISGSIIANFFSRRDEKAEEKARACLLINRVFLLINLYSKGVLIS